MIARLMTALFVFLVVAVARAEAPPDQRPFLRIEAGMHLNSVKSIAVSPDGKLLATGSHDKTVRLWSTRDGELLRTFRIPIGEGDDGKIYCVALSPDGHRLAVGGFMHQASDEDIFLFDTQTGALVRRLGQLPGVVFDLAFSPDGQLLAAGLGGGNGIRLWNARDNFGQAPASDPNLPHNVNTVAFDRANRLALTAVDGTIRLYEAKDASPPELIHLKTRTSSHGEPFGVAFSPDGRTLAVGHYYSTAIDLLDAATLAPSPGGGVNTSFADNGELGSVAWSLDGELLIAGGSYDDENSINPIVLWDRAGRGNPRFLGKQDDTIFDVKTLPNGDIAWSGGGAAFGVRAATGEDRWLLELVIADMRGKKGDQFSIAPSGASVLFSLSYGAEDPWLFDVASLRFAPPWWRPWHFISPSISGLPVENWEDEDRPTINGKELKLRQYETSRSLAVAPDGRSFILGTSWQIRKYDDAGEQSLWPGPINVPGVVWGVNLSADSSIIVAAIGDGTIRWYRASDGAELLAFFVHVPDKRWVAWTPTGYYAASPNGDDLIGWHVNGKTWDDPVKWFPASKFRVRFHRPDVVQLVLNTKDEAEAIKQANAARGITSEPEIDMRD